MADDATREQFIAGLVDMIEADSETGLARVENLRDSAMARIEKGKGQVGMVIQGQLNGKQAQLSVGMDALQMFGACAEAIRRWLGNQPTTTAADFTCFQR